MKPFFLYSIFIIFTFSVKAQSIKSNLNKTVDSINTIIVKTKMIRFANHNSEVFYPTKINANLQGNVFCVDSTTNENVELKRIIFNLLQVNSFVTKGNEIMALGKDQKTVVSILIGNNKNREAFKKQLIALQLICITH